MKALKNHHLPYNTLSGCLEAHFGDRAAPRDSRRTEPRNYREPEQGFKTILFQSLPLQLDYMSARRKDSAHRSHRLTQIISLFK